MNVALIYPEQIKGIIETKLSGGWAIFHGRMDIISQVEERIYTPGTARNADFEIIGIMHPLIFGKKTDELKKLLNMPDDFERILLISFDDWIGNNLKIQLTGINARHSAEKNIKRIAEDIAAQFRISRGEYP